MTHLLAYRGHLTLIACALLCFGCGDDEDDNGRQILDAGADADGDSGGDQDAEPADTGSDSGADTTTDGDDDADVDVGQPDVDYTVEPGALMFPARGSTSAESGRGTFAFGAATAATQIEDMNTAVDWHTWTLPEDQGGLGRGAGFIGDASRGFSRVDEDLALVVALNLDIYRFSVEWARVEPTRDSVDQSAVDHYGEVIDALVAAGVTPVVTLHHFSNPTWIHDPRDPRCEQGASDTNLCGWGPGDASAAIEELAEHARLLGATYGDRVDDWCTLNEPINYLLAGYGVGQFPPGLPLLLSGFERDFLPTVRNYLAAHAAVYDALKESDTIDADGDGVAASVGLTKGAAWWFPSRDNERSDHPEDVAAAERISFFYNVLFVKAIIDGAFDPDADGELDEDHPEWRGKLDWLGVQYYFRAGATGKNPIFPAVDVTPCIEGFDLGSCVPPADPTKYIPAMEYEYWEPGIYALLMDYHQRWPDLPMTVTESGLATNVGARRAEHVVRSLEQIWQARQDGADVRGYYHWSLTDNFEWARGYEPRFGLYTVDYDDTYDRTPTLGATVLSEIAGTRTITQGQRDEHGGLGPMTPESLD